MKKHNELVAQHIESLVEDLAITYSRPMPTSYVESLRGIMQSFAREHGFDEETICDDIRDAMFRRNRTGERVFRGIAY